MCVGPTLGGRSLTLKDWVNEGLMALFFFSVGLEIKSELCEGALASASKAALPCIAALGGMVVPMLVYLLVQVVLPGGSSCGFTVPMATDIAFAMSVFCLFRQRMPAATGPFLLALATVDDLGAIVVIIMSGGSTLAPKFVAASACVLALTFEQGRRGLRGSTRRFAVLGVALWYCLLRSGLSADIAGVLCALCMPMRTVKGLPVVRRLIRYWSSISAVIILPIFALANCAVPFFHHEDAGSGAGVAVAVPVGVALGLFLGKPIGIYSFTSMSVKLGIANLPSGFRMEHVAVVGVLGGIGFTMCLFLVDHSLEKRQAQVTKLAVLGASFASAMVGAIGMAARSPPKRLVTKTSIVQLNHRGVDN
jgi:NhaA family Na+:H+ antiporter